MTQAEFNQNSKYRITIEPVTEEPVHCKEFFTPSETFSISNLPESPTNYYLSEILSGLLIQKNSEDYSLISEFPTNHPEARIQIDEMILARNMQYEFGSTLFKVLQISPENLTFQLIFRTNPPQQYYINDKTTIGRQNTSIEIEDPEAAENHIQITPKNNFWTIKNISEEKSLFRYLHNPSSLCETEPSR